MWDRNVMSIVMSIVIGEYLRQWRQQDQGLTKARFLQQKKKKPGQAALSVSSPLQQFDKGRPLAATICPYYSNSQSVLQF